jgi:hypothetical protein
MLEHVTTVVQIDLLIKDTWYVGRGRNANLGLWDGDWFLVLAKKFDQYVIKREDYYTATWGTFQPFMPLLFDKGSVFERGKHDRPYCEKLVFDLGYLDLVKTLHC